MNESASKQVNKQHFADKNRTQKHFADKSITQKQKYKILFIIRGVYEIKLNIKII